MLPSIPLTIWPSTAFCLTIERMTAQNPLFCRMAEFLSYHRLHRHSMPSKVLASSGKPCLSPFDSRWLMAAPLFNSVGADMELGGMQFPYSVSNALMLPFTAANVGTMSYPFLTIAAANMLRAAGSPSQIQRFLPPMLEGRCFGTMNLSETQAGSSLGDITTTAVSIGNGKYKIKGSKMYVQVLLLFASLFLPHMRCKVDIGGRARFI